MSVRIMVGDVRARLAQLPAESVHCIWTSVPYWGLRSYGTEPQVWGDEVVQACEHEWGDPLHMPRAGAGRHGETSQFIQQSRAVTEAQVAGAQATKGQLCRNCGGWRGEHGLEPTLAMWLTHEVLIWRELRRVLRKDGTAWLNCGDAYATSPNGRSAAATKAVGDDDRTFRDKPVSTVGVLKSKQRLMLPARLALALQEDDGSDLYAPRDDLTGEERGCLTKILSALEPTHANISASASRPIPSASANGIETSALPIPKNIGRSAGDTTPPTKTPRSAEPPSTIESGTTGSGSPPSLHTAGPAPAAQRAPLSSLSLTTPPSAGPSTGDSSKSCISTSGNTSDVKATRKTAASGCSATTATRRRRTTDSALIRKCDIPPQHLHLFRLVREERWFLRDEVIWAKPNPMPSSVEDRTTPAHEMLYLLTRSARYYYDAEAIKEPASPGTHARLSQASIQSQMGGAKQDAYDAAGLNDGSRRPSDILKSLHNKARKLAEPGSGIKNNTSMDAALAIMPPDRNKRSVWTIATEPFPGAHFATAPTALVEPCIKAGTSERGCCPGCGAPWRRLVKGLPPASSWHDHSADDTQGASQNGSERKRRYLESLSHPRETTGWEPTCKCPPAEPVPCTVLDPFGGAGTTALVADRLRRDAILIELNPAYAEIARERIQGDACLLSQVETVTA